MKNYLIESLTSYMGKLDEDCNKEEQGLEEARNPENDEINAALRKGTNGGRLTAKEKVKEKHANRNKNESLLLKEDYYNPFDVYGHKLSKMLDNAVYNFIDEDEFLDQFYDADADEFFGIDDNAISTIKTRAKKYAIQILDEDIISECGEEFANSVIEALKTPK